MDGNNVSHESVGKHYAVWEFCNAEDHSCCELMSFSVCDTALYRLFNMQSDVQARNNASPASSARRFPLKYEVKC